MGELTAVESLSSRLAAFGKGASMGLMSEASSTGEAEDGLVSSVSSCGHITRQGAVTTVQVCRTLNR